MLVTSSHRQRPRILHLIVGIGITTIFSYLLLQFFRPLLADSTTQLLSLGKIALEKPLDFENSTLVLRMMDGSDLSLALTWQRSGLFSLIVFEWLFVFLVFPLEGPLWKKIAWLEVGNFIGLAWSFIRLLTVTLIAYHFGTSAFVLAEFVTSPVVDFLWVIPVWAVGLSAVVSARRKSCRQKRG